MLTFFTVNRAFYNFDVTAFVEPQKKAFAVTIKRDRTIIDTRDETSVGAPKWHELDTVEKADSFCGRIAEFYYNSAHTSDRATVAKPVKAGPIALDVMASINVVDHFREEIRDDELKQREQSSFGRSFASLVRSDLISSRMSEIASAQDNARLADSNVKLPLTAWRDGRDLSKWVDGYPTLTDEMRAALEAFAAVYGKKWRDELSMVYWYNARIWEGPVAGMGTTLHYIRNHFGPTWLYDVYAPRVIVR